MNHYTFEGQSLTIPEIRLLVPILSERTIRRHLAEGRNTRQAMLAYNSSAKLSAAGKKSHANAKSRGWGFA